MNVLRISEEIENVNNLNYISDGIPEVVVDRDSRSVESTKKRVILDLNLKDESDDDKMKILKRELFDKISDVICIAYKYQAFNGKIKAMGLTPNEREILIASIISADLEDDKRYVRSRIGFGYEYAIDGLYNFKLQPLKCKWEEIAAYIPDYFTPEELKEFVSYLIGEKKGRKIYIDGETVYDGKCRKLERSRLIPGGSSRKIVKEALLSGAGEICVIGKLTECDVEGLRKYFGDKILLSRG
mgnify:CR=1 FL=1